MRKYQLLGSVGSFSVFLVACTLSIESLKDSVPPAQPLPVTAAASRVSVATMPSQHTSSSVQPSKNTVASPLSSVTQSNRPPQLRPDMALRPVNSTQSNAESIQQLTNPPRNATEMANPVTNPPRNVTNPPRGFTAATGRATIPANYGGMVADAGFSLKHLLMPPAWAGILSLSIFDHLKPLVIGHSFTDAGFADGKTETNGALSAQYFIGQIPMPNPPQELEIGLASLNGQDLLLTALVQPKEGEVIQQDLNVITTATALLKQARPALSVSAIQGSAELIRMTQEVESYLATASHPNVKQAPQLLALAQQLADQLLNKVLSTLIPSTAPQIMTSPVVASPLLPSIAPSPIPIVDVLPTPVTTATPTATPTPTPTPSPSASLVGNVLNGLLP